jgi:hypothetical protein
MVPCVGLDGRFCSWGDVVMAVLCVSGKPGVERNIQVADAVDDAKQQSVAAADFRGAGEVLGAVIAVVRAQTAACAGRSCVVEAGGTETGRGRVGDHAGTEVDVGTVWGGHLGRHDWHCVCVVLGGWCSDTGTCVVWRTGTST